MGLCNCGMSMCCDKDMYCVVACDPDYHDREGGSNALAWRSRLRPGCEGAASGSQALRGEAPEETALLLQTSLRAAVASTDGTPAALRGRVRFGAAGGGASEPPPGAESRNPTSPIRGRWNSELLEAGLMTGHLRDPLRMETFDECDRGLLLDGVVQCLGTITKASAAREPVVRPASLEALMEAPRTSAATPGGTIPARPEKSESSERPEMKDSKVFLGQWNQVRIEADKLEAILKVQGYGWATRKLVVNVGLSMAFSLDADGKMLCSTKVMGQPAQVVKCVDGATLEADAFGAKLVYKFHWEGDAIVLELKTYRGNTVNEATITHRYDVATGLIVVENRGVEGTYKRFLERTR